jgi:hypothetical protein
MKRKVLIGLAAVIVIILTVVAVRELVYEPEIRDWYDLHAVRRHLDRSYVLMNDLDSTTAGYEELAGPTANGGKGWEPIGTTVSFPSDGDEQIVGAYPFVGTFDGQGHEIRDLFINRPDENYVGLLRQVGEEGVVENVRVVSGTVTANRTVGGLVGSNSGTVNKCFFSGNLIGSQLVGGLVGATANWASVSNSYSNASVTGDQWVGGLVGANLAGTIRSCHATGSVVGENRIGGLVGLNLGANVTGSYFSGNVTGHEYVGGLVGYSSGTVSSSYAGATVTGYNDVGGLVGSNGDTVSNSYSGGNVIGHEYVGGLVGSNGDTVSNSYSSGTVSGAEGAGGLVGQNDHGTVSGSFLDVETSGMKESDGGTAKNATAMRDIAVFSGAGWNITAVALNQTDVAHIWNIVDNVTYPFLSWE